MANPFDVLKERGFLQQSTGEAEVRALFDAGRQPVYIGFDATARSLHIGSLLPIMALAHVQREGHLPIALLGSGTTLVGDPSGRDEARPILPEEEVRRNAGAIRAQVERYVKLDGVAGLSLDNAEWLVPLNYIRFLREVGRHFSVNRMLAAEAYRIRMEKGLSFLEFNYQILQAYDFLVLYRKTGCRLQMGGDDQWGNILAGTDLVRRVEGADAHAMTWPLLATATGAKMGKSVAGAVWLDSGMLPVHDFYQYWVNVDDRDVGRFLALFTFLPMEEVRRLAGLQDAAIREAKEVLAFEVTRLCHGEEEARKAQAAAKAAFGAGGDEDALPTLTLTRAEVEKGIGVTDLLVRAGFAKSKTDAHRLIDQGGASLGETPIADWRAVLGPAEIPAGGVKLWAGKKRVVKVRIAE